MIKQLFKNISDQEKSEAMKKLIENSVPSKDFFNGCFVCLNGHLWFVNR